MQVIAITKRRWYKKRRKEKTKVDEQAKNLTLFDESPEI
jgi:hypothetical protein